MRSALLTVLLAAFFFGATARADDVFVAATVTASSGADPWRVFTDGHEGPGFCFGGDKSPVGETITVELAAPQKIDLVELHGTIVAAEVIGDGGAPIRWHDDPRGLSTFVGPLPAPVSRLLIRVTEAGEGGCLSAITLGRGRLLISIPETRIVPLVGVDGKAAAKLVPSAKRALAALRSCDGRGLGAALAMPFVLSTGYTAESQGASWSDARYATADAVVAACRQRAFRHFLRGRRLDAGSLVGPGAVTLGDLHLRWSDGAWRVTGADDLHDEP